MPSVLIRFHLACASSRSGEPYWIASKLTELILCGLFRSIAKQDVGGRKASTVLVGGITIVRGHSDMQFGPNPGENGGAFLRDIIEG